MSALSLELQQTTVNESTVRIFGVKFDFSPPTIQQNFYFVELLVGLCYNKHIEWVVIPFRKSV